MPCAITLFSPELSELYHVTIIKKGALGRKRKNIIVQNKDICEGSTLGTFVLLYMNGIVEL